jgi:hypothetical protein
MKTASHRLTPAPQTRATRASNLADVYQCILCKKEFLYAAPFKAHHVHTHLPIERCLDADELRALDYEQNATGVWRATQATQLSPAQLNRLPTIRHDLEGLLNVPLAYPSGVPLESYFKAIKQGVSNALFDDSRFPETRDGRAA